MDKSAIDKAIKEAEMFAEEDKKQKEKIEIKNNAEHIIFQSEKTLNDLGDKVTDDEKQPVREAIERLRLVVNSEDTDAIKAATDELQKKFYDISAKLYQNNQVDPNDQSNYQDTPGGDGFDGDDNGGGDDDFVSTEFKDEE
jgi:molecular chaperone DnaK